MSPALPWLVSITVPGKGSSSVKAVECTAQTNPSFKFTTYLSSESQDLEKPGSLSPPHPGVEERLAPFLAPCEGPLLSPDGCTGHLVRESPSEWVYGAATAWWDNGFWSSFQGL